MSENQWLFLLFHIGLKKELPSSASTSVAVVLRHMLLDHTQTSPCFSHLFSNQWQSPICFRSWPTSVSYLPFCLRLDLWRSPLPHPADTCCALVFHNIQSSWTHKYNQNSLCLKVLVHRETFSECDSAMNWAKALIVIFCVMRKFPDISSFGQREQLLGFT